MKTEPTRVRSVCVWITMALIALVCSGCGQRDTTGPVEAAKKSDLDTETPQDIEGQLQLAYKHYLGAEIPLNYQKASELFLMAANGGSSEAQFALGVMHQNGQGVPINYINAAKWYTKSAMKDNPNGQYLLGLSYKEGSGVPKDNLEAFKWLDLAADHGHVAHLEARNQLALLLTPDMVAEGRRRADQFRIYELPALYKDLTEDSPEQAKQISTPPQGDGSQIKP